MMEVIDREVAMSHIPQDVQNAISTILSWGYALELENQILRQRMKEVSRLSCDGDVDAVMNATHRNTEAAVRKRLLSMFASEVARLTPAAAQRPPRKGTLT